MTMMVRFIQKAYKPLTVILLFALIVVIIKRTGKKEEGEVTYKSDEKARQPVSVQVAECFRGELVMRVTAAGLVRPARQTGIIPKISGTVVELLAREGDRVQKGELLVRLDDREAKLEWLSARDNLSKAEDSFVEKIMSSSAALDAQTDSQPDYMKKIDTIVRELERSVQQGTADESDLEMARLWQSSIKNFTDERVEERWASSTGLTAAKIAVDQAKYRLDQCRVVAPFTGILGEQDICLGQELSSGKSIFTLVDLSAVYMAAQCLESEVAHVRTGSRAQVRLPAFPGEVFNGEVVSINPIVDEKTRTCRITVKIANPDRQIRAGMYAEASLEAARYQDRLLVPRAAVLERDGRTLVFIAREGLAKWCYVDLGLSNDEYYEVLSSAFDLKAGEKVLIEGHYTLAHDSPIKIIE